jgi:hypothetical protein
MWKWIVATTPEKYPYLIALNKLGIAMQSGKSAQRMRSKVALYPLPAYAPLYKDAPSSLPPELLHTGLPPQPHQPVPAGVGAVVWAGAIQVLHPLLIARQVGNGAPEVVTAS